MPYARKPVFLPACPASASPAGDGFFARFDGPACAIRRALAIQEAMRELDLEMRIGLHAGKCELLDGKLAGTIMDSKPRSGAVQLQVAGSAR